MESTSGEKLKQLQFEYDQLRKEILHNDIMNFQSLGAIITFAGVIAGIAFTGSKTMEVKSILFFIAQIISMIGLFLSLDREYSTFSVASYLRVFVEENMDYVKWETRLNEFRQKCPNQGYKRFSNLQLIYILIIIANLVGVVYHCSFNETGKIIITESCVLMMIIIVWIIISVCFLVKAHYTHIKYVVNNKSTFDKNWLSIK